MINEKHAKLYCFQELSLIENYDKAVADATQAWDIHHRLEIQGDKILTRAELKAQGLYWQRPASELVFLTHAEHTRLHHREKTPSEEARRKMSEARRGKYCGKNHPMFGKHHSEEARQKMSKSHIGIQSGEKNPMWGKPGANLGTRWWNDGVQNVRAKESPGEGWVRGRLRPPKT